MPAKVTPFEDFTLSPRARKYEGGEESQVSFFLTQYDHGEGPDLHVHPYPETFIVTEGTARFTAGDDELVVDAGNVVVVPAETVHGFKNAGDAKLRVTSIHPSPRVIQTDL